MNIATPEQRRKLIDLLWDHAVRVVEGPDNQGAGVDPDQVWTVFKSNLAEAGMELDLTSAGDGADEPNDVGLSKEQMAALTTGHPLPGIIGAKRRGDRA